MKNSKSKTKAKIAILSSLMSFPTINQKDWQGSFSDDNAKPGDLVSLCSAPESKWYLSWVLETKDGGAFGSTQYLLESIEDSSLCWWSNVGLNIYNREKVAERPTWRWSDAQFDFYRKWLKACKRNDAYIVLPCLPEFKDNSVVLDVRIRFGFSDFKNKQSFQNWKKVTIKSMEEYYLSSVEKYQSQKTNAA